MSGKWRHIQGNFLALLAAAVALVAPSPVHAQTAPMRQPLGIYYRLTIQPDTNSNVSNTVTAALTNTAISGILAVFTWDNLSYTSSNNPLAGTNNWQLLDDVFDTVAQWNANHPTNLPKNIQLGINPGFHTPTWVLSNLVSCDAMFKTNAAGSIVNSNLINSNQTWLTLVGVDTNKVTTNCGCAMFYETESKIRPQLLPLPLPWNQFYKNAWADFIRAVAGKYGDNPLLVSITVAGPTSSSSEMILPNEKNDPTNYLKWNPLFALEFPSHPEYTNTDAVFITEWENAIDLFGAAFSNITLVVTTGSGLPDFNGTNNLPVGNYTVPPGFCPMCADTNNMSTMMDCAAETTILAYFVDPQHGGHNAKAVQEDGLRASAVHLHPLGDGDLDSHGIKWLAQATASGSSPLPGTSNVVSRVLGGLQLGDGGSITQNPDTAGCPQIGNNCTNILPEQAIYNVMRAYFNGTLIGSNYGLTSSNLPLNYLQIYYEDVLYANTNLMGTNVVDGFGNTNFMTAQMLFTTASTQIAEIAELGLNIQPVGQTVQISWLASVAATQLQVNHNLANTNGWNPDAHTPSLTNSFYQISFHPNANASFFRLVTPLNQ